MNILQSIEAVSIPVFLQYSGMSSSLSLQVYGVLTGMALPCILFPSAITNAVSSMLLPTVAEIQEMKEKRTSGYHFKNRLFLHISWMFLLYFPANIRGMDWNLSVQKYACG